jgi:hypothetical protein
MSGEKALECNFAILKQTAEDSFLIQICNQRGEMKFLGDYVFKD